MKKLMNVFNNIKIPALIVMLSVFVLSSCKKNDPEIIRTPAAGLVAFNLAPDQQAVVFSLSGNSFGNAALNYNGYTGNYLPVYLGNREVRSYDYNTGSTLAISNMNFMDSSYYSVFLVGANGAYRNIVVEDNYNNVLPAAGKAWVRYVNGITDSTARPNIKIGSISEAASYANVSDFRQVNAGSINASVSNGDKIDANRTLTFEENKIYTILFVGVPGATDSTKSVKIRYIENGTATL